MFVGFFTVVVLLCFVLFSERAKPSGAVTDVSGERAGTRSSQGLCCLTRRRPEPSLGRDVMRPVAFLSLPGLEGLSSVISASDCLRQPCKWPLEHNQ